MRGEVSTVARGSCLAQADCRAEGAVRMRAAAGEVWGELVGGTGGWRLHSIADFSFCLSPRQYLTAWHGLECPGEGEVTVDASLVLTHIGTVCLPDLLLQPGAFMPQPGIACKVSPGLCGCQEKSGSTEVK